MVDRFLVATDSRVVEKKAAEFGIPVVITGSDVKTGTERCAEVAKEWECEIVVDAQGDWPEISHRDLDKLVSAMVETKALVGTLYRPLDDEDKAGDPNIVKTIKDANGFAVYFSRLPVPFSKKGERVPRLRHIGIYAFQRQALLDFGCLPFDTPMSGEGLEQLRFIYNGIPVKLVQAEGDPWGIETKADYEAFLNRLQSKK